MFRLLAILVTVFPRGQDSVVVLQIKAKPWSASDLGAAAKLDPAIIILTNIIVISFIPYPQLELPHDYQMRQ